MIKKLLVLAFGIVLFSLNLKAQESFDKWPALKNFHTVISQTFHPAEEGNRSPVKKRSGELLKKSNVASQI